MKQAQLAESVTIMVYAFVRRILVDPEEMIPNPGVA
jgi:hypothetical protein